MPDQVEGDMPDRAEVEAALAFADRDIRSTPNRSKQTTKFITFYLFDSQQKTAGLDG
jgi:hypothetical protein